MDLEKSHVSMKSYIISLIAVAGVTITGTGIYFEVVNGNARLNYVNERLDKKTARIESDVAAEFKLIRARLDLLEKKGSDDN